MWSNFTGEQLKAKFIPGEYNEITDLLSISGSKDCPSDARRHKNNDTYKKEVKKGTEVMHALTDDEVWRMLHHGHVGMRTTQKSILENLSMKGYVKRQMVEVWNLSVALRRM